ncbi:MAG: tRNA-intron lyase [Thaumarchaeota archaeon]|nr:tRNA-intron lyase [Nitrososphaerota archaeon]MDD9812975.1 tRNA-intron lyase [Nitrososphaerota archaeon]MDD9842779.1 tRNA-intron lyase [Nitrososphaerota archaeon]
MRAELVGGRVVVWPPRDAARLFEGGYYGKPIGIPKPKPGEIDVPLVLDMFEARYLEARSAISVYEGARRVSRRSLERTCREGHEHFDTKYAVYEHFRDLGYIVTTGIKFGCDFAVYERGPGIDHAPYLVQAHARGDAITATGTVLAGRLATTVKKQFILAMPDGRGGISLVSLDWWRA